MSQRRYIVLILDSRSPIEIVVDDEDRRLLPGRAMQDVPEEDVSVIKARLASGDLQDRNLSFQEQRPVEERWSRDRAAAEQAEIDTEGEAERDDEPTSKPKRPATAARRRTARTRRRSKPKS